MKQKLYKTALLTVVFSGIFLMGTAASPRPKYSNLRSEASRECRSLTGARNPREIKKVRKSNEYHKLQKLVRTRHW